MLRLCALKTPSALPCVRVGLNGLVAGTVILLAAALNCATGLAHAETTGAVMHAEDEMSGPDLLALIARMVGDGDLRNVDRFLEVLNAKLVLRPGFDNVEGSVRLTRVLVTTEPEVRPFTDPLFIYFLSIQDSSTRPTPFPPLIAMMTLTTARKSCITSDDLVRQFGSGFKDVPRLLAGSTYSLAKQVGSSVDYQTTLSATFVRNWNCALAIQIGQVSVRTSPR